MNNHTAVNKISTKINEIIIIRQIYQLKYVLKSINKNYAINK